MNKIQATMLIMGAMLHGFYKKWSNKFESNTDDIKGSKKPSIISLKKKYNNSKYRPYL